MKTKPAPKKSAKRRAATPAMRDTFTVRDVSRQTQAVFSTALKLGQVHVRSRTGDSFVVTAVPRKVNQRVKESRDFLAGLEAVHQRFREAGFRGLSKEVSDKLERMIGGDEP